MDKKKLESTLFKLIQEFYDDFQMRTGFKLKIDEDNNFYIVTMKPKNWIRLGNVIDLLNNHENYTIE